MILAGELGQETSGKSVVWEFLLPSHCISNHGSHEDTTQGMKTEFSALLKSHFGWQKNKNTTFEAACIFIVFYIFLLSHRSTKRTCIKFQCLV